MLSGDAMLEVLFKATLKLTQALTGVNVAVGFGFTFILIFVLLTQPLLVVAVNTAKKFPEVA